MPRPSDHPPAPPSRGSTRSIDAGTVAIWRLFRTATAPSSAGAQGTAGRGLRVRADCGRVSISPGALEARLIDAFGSVAEFKSQFSAAGAGQFGAGWCWLVVETDGTLK
ncbi:MAG: hypothetical protein GDA52_09760, partial [Rhodobacteraceae bacterium]|nr:hypothetical protein [Paracoccaceae bacterium]